MKTFFLRLLPLLFFLGAHFPAEAQRQSENSFRSVFGPKALVGYLAYFPVDYANNPQKKYPLLIFLHGAGEKVFNPQDLSNLYMVKVNGPPSLIEQGQDFPFIVISPQCPFSTWDDVSTDGFQTSVNKPGEFVNEILDTLLHRYRVDTDRIFVTGLSMGGAATWSFISKYPQRVTAAIPIAGWVDESDACAIASNHVAVWAFQGSEDGPGNITSEVDQINGCNPNSNAKATIYEGVGHNAWTITYNNTGPGIAPDNIYDWLMRQSKKQLSLALEEVTIPAFEKTGEIKLYPIPSKNEVHIVYDAFIEGDIEVQVMDETSKKLLGETFLVSKGPNNLRIDLSILKNGSYTLLMMGISQRKAIPLIVIK